MPVRSFFSRHAREDTSEGRVAKISLRRRLILVTAVAVLAVLAIVPSLPDGDGPSDSAGATTETTLELQRIAKSTSAGFRFESTTDPSMSVPTTAAPTTVPPTTVAPTTVPPTTAAPTTVPPTTAAPTTVPPTTAPPATQAPATAPPATEAPVSSSGSGVWQQLAECEAGGNWAINTGNGYYGGLQFSLGSWQAVGGTGYPHEASVSTQIAMGERLRAAQGWGAWPHCSRELGLR